MTTLDLPLELNLEAVHFTDEQFYQLCIHNPEMAIEQNAQGVLIVMPPLAVRVAIKKWS
jgi:Uma2 family endonuclease